MKTESGVRARSDNPRSRGPAAAPDLLRVQPHSIIETVTAPGEPSTSISSFRVGAPLMQPY